MGLFCRHPKYFFFRWFSCAYFIILFFYNKLIQQQLANNNATDKLIQPTAPPSLTIQQQILDMKEQPKLKTTEENPIINQLHILKQKLDQRANIITNLTQELHKQKAVTLKMIEEFGQHQQKLLNRLSRLEEINIKYIKDYLKVEKQLEIQEFATTQSLIDCSPDYFFTIKYQDFKEELSKQSNTPQHLQQQQQLVNNCTQLMQNFLKDKQPNYDHILSTLKQQRPAKLKEIKGLDAFKLNKQQDKFIEAIKGKITILNQKLQSLDNNNMIEVFNLRKEIQQDIRKLNPELVAVSLEDSQQEQQALQNFMEEVVATNLQPNSPQQAIAEQMLQAHFQSLERTLEQQTQKYGKEFITQSIKQLDIPQQAKNSILQNQNYQQLMAAKKKGERRLKKEQQLSNPANSQGLKEEEDEEEQVEFEETQSARKEPRKKRIIKKRKVKRENGEEQEEEYVEYEDEEEEEQFENIGQQKQEGSFKSKKKEQRDFSDPNEPSNEQFQILDTSQLLAEAKQKRQQAKSKKGSKINSAFETTMTKSFFQEQQKARDTLIGKQQSELKEHEKVIDKLITFIKKEFKEKKLDEIDADDPEQLMGYYFRVNEKKYVDIKEEMKEIENEKKFVEKENNSLKEEKTELERHNQKLQEENLEVKEQMQKLELLKAQAEEQKMNILKTLEQEKGKHTSTMQDNQNYKLKLDLQRIEIEALSDIYEGIKNNTVGFHHITTRTENLVKLSLQTLFSTCLNKVKPEELIERLQNIIQLIKVNMKLKNDITYDLNITDFLISQEDKVKRQFSLKINQDILPFTSSLNGLKLITPNPNDSSEEKSEKSKSFAQDLQSMAFEIIQRSFNKTEKAIEVEKKPIILQPQIQEPVLDFPKSEMEGISEDILLPLLSLLKPKQESTPLEPNQPINQVLSEECPSEPKKQEKVLDETFLDCMIERIKQMKFSKFTTDEDLKQMYNKYKQALDCLQRAEKLNEEHQMKFQEFLKDLEAKGAQKAPQSLEDKLFYMQRVIKTQNQLLQEQRKQFQETILKQVQKSEELSKNILKEIKLKRQQTIR